MEQKGSESSCYFIYSLLLEQLKDSSKHKRTFRKAAEHLKTEDRKSSLYNPENEQH